MTYFMLGAVNTREVYRAGIEKEILLKMECMYVGVLRSWWQHIRRLQKVAEWRIFQAFTLDSYNSDVNTADMVLNSSDETCHLKKRR